MRISWSSGHPAYRPDCFRFHVLFNDGPAPPKCWLADEEAGEVRCYAVNDAGRPYPDPENPSRPKSVVHKGRVKIIEKARA